MAKRAKSLKGHLLLDGGSLQGSYFHRTVVLICQHDADGAFGLVLNRSAESTVGDAVSANLPTSLKDLPLFLGGPVQPNALSYLYSDPSLESGNVMPHLSVGHALDELTELGENPSLTRRLMVFAGYAGWDAGQLDDELRRNAWLTHPAHLDLLFTAKPTELWRQILMKKGWHYRLLAESPDDLSRN